MSKPIVVDGVEYESIRKACDHFGIKKHDYDNRKKGGWTDRQIFELDPPPVVMRKGTSITVEGIEFVSVKQACEHFGADEKRYWGRKGMGLTDRQCLGLDPLPSGLKSQQVDEAEKAKKRRGKNAGFDADGNPVSKSISAGQKFGRWTALEDVECVTTRTKVHCRCDCGKEGHPNYQTLSNGAAGCQFCCRSLTRGKGKKLQRNATKPGDVFHRWTVTGESYKHGKSRKVYAPCRCECGTERDVMVQGLLSGASKSCGCLNIEIRSNSQRLIGKRFGRLVVKSFSRRETKASGRPGDAYYNCVCDCGQAVEVCSKHLHHRQERNGTRGTQSCGCWQSEVASAAGTRMVTEGRLANARFPYEGKMGNFLMRSRWEVAVAYELDKRGWAFEFEPGPYEAAGLSYTPDFYVPSEDLYIEVKGLVRENFEEKWAAFSENRKTLLLDKAGVEEFTSRTIHSIDKEYREIEIDPADGRNRWYYVGSKSHNAKLTEERVGWIRAFWAGVKDSEKTEALRRLAGIYGMTTSGLKSVVNGETWRHV